jgi:radical SAM protein with 4Fe4S-binding SPASM domain
MSDEQFLATVEQFNRTRDFSDKGFKSVCYAPFVSMYFDQLGYVRVCCQNTTHVIGNVNSQSLDEIWNGERARKLRDAVKIADLRQGCRFCEWQFIEGNSSGTFIKSFDIFPVLNDSPQFPKLMEFSISNTCNLECIMCNGEWSSSIRSRREKLPPLPKAYGDRFFEQLRPYLPHLQSANFLGGEPFLEQEAYRIWDMMIEDGLHTPCHITTNGTQFNAKVERVLDHLPLSISISMDGATKETVERIRKNANYEVVLENFHRFREYAAKRGTFFGLTYCLMTYNWHEFGDYLLFADQWDVNVYVNTVPWPPEASLYQLSTAQLSEIVNALQERDEFYRSRLKRNLRAWNEELDKLRAACQLSSGPSYVKLRNTEESNDPLAVLNASDPPMTLARAREILSEWSGGTPVASVRCDKHLVIKESDLETIPAFGLESISLFQRRLPSVQLLLAEKMGEDIRQVKTERLSTYIDDVTEFRNRADVVTTVRALSIPIFEGEEMMGMDVCIGYRR